MCKSNIQKNKEVKTFEGFEVVNESELANMESYNGGRQFYTERAGQEKVSEAASVEAKLRRHKVFGEKIPESKINQLLKLEHPPEPKFQVRTLEEIKAMGRFEKKNYNKRMKAFEKERAKWDKTKAGIAWKNRISELMPDIEKITERAKQENGDYIKMSDRELEIAIKQLTIEYGYKEIEADPNVMDEMLEKEVSKEFVEKEEMISRLEARRVERNNKIGTSGITRYMTSTSSRREMNQFFRSDKRDLGGPNISQWAEEGKKLLSRTRLSRDLVSKRAVKDVTEVAHMLGLKNPESMSEKDIKEELLTRMTSKEPVIMTEKGFCSTSVNTKSGYEASNDGNIGVEFIILCKKGTKGLNYMHRGSNEKERELLLCPGTQFEVVNAFFNDGSGGEHDERQIVEGNKKSWKIYLKTVVDDEEKWNA